MQLRFGYILFLGGPTRHSKAEKANTHERIVTIAAKKFREEGLAGIGIADLMKEAGLTGRILLREVTPRITAPTLLSQSSSFAKRR